LNFLDDQYKDLVTDILNGGNIKTDRTGTGTRSVFGQYIYHTMQDGFPIITMKEVWWKGVVTELLWMLSGNTNIQPMVKDGNYIWVGDAYKKFIQNSVPHDHLETKEEFIDKIKTDDKFAEKWGELGPVYGSQWRSWNEQLDVKHPNIKNENYSLTLKNSIDQIQNLINDLKTNPDSRRLMVNAYNISEIENMVLPPCHYGFQVYTRELSLEERNEFYTGNYLGLPMKSHQELDNVIPGRTASIGGPVIPKRAISLMWNQRSVDVPLGLPFNIASYGLLLHILAKMTNMIPDQLFGNLGDCHIYNNQLEQARKMVNEAQYNFDLPKLQIRDNVNFNGTIDDMLQSCTWEDFKLDGYQNGGKFEFELNN